MLADLTPMDFFQSNCMHTCILILDFYGDNKANGEMTQKHEPCFSKDIKITAFRHGRRGAVDASTSSETGARGFESRETGMRLELHCHWKAISV
jgi:hypothetical protein